MNKRIMLVVLIIIGLIVIASLAYDRKLDRNVGERIPGYLSSYPEIGYFKINPYTILEELERGKNNVFTPLLEDPNSVASLTDTTFLWTQADFLRIASELGIVVWDDPMEFNDWSIYDFIFQGGCLDNPTGFGSGSITYFKSTSVNGKKVYVTRLVEIQPYYSMVRWGSGATYPQPILHKWSGFNLAKTKITIGEALQISEEHGGIEARRQINNQCLIVVSAFRNTDKWSVEYISTPFSLLIDPYSGKYEIFGINQ